MEEGTSLNNNGVRYIDTIITLKIVLKPTLATCETSDGFATGPRVTNGNTGKSSLVNIKSPAGAGQHNIFLSYEKVMQPCLDSKSNLRLQAARVTSLSLPISCHVIFLLQYPAFLYKQFSEEI